jgi:hypothetical protein
MCNAGTLPAGQWLASLCGWVCVSAEVPQALGYEVPDV